MLLKKESGAWRIKGLGSGAGRRRHARQVDGRLVYEFPRKTETVIQTLWSRLSRAKSHLFGIYLLGTLSLVTSSL
jgi:hypothetical protein